MIDFNALTRTLAFYVNTLLAIRWLKRIKIRTWLLVSYDEWYISYNTIQYIYIYINTNLMCTRNCYNIIDILFDTIYIIDTSE